MPELPEVEVVKRGLARRLIGKTISDIDVRYKKSFNEDPALIKKYVMGSKVTDVRRYQKMIIIDLSSGWSLVIHLKMTGQLVFVRDKTDDPTSPMASFGTSRGQVTGKADFAGGHPEKAYEQPLPHKHTHVIFSFKNDGVLYFNDLRKFGWVKLLQRKITNSKHLRGGGAKRDLLEGGNNKLMLGDFLASFHYSPDPLSKKWPLDHFKKAMKNRNVTIKQILMDQTVAAGVGNIYADEALFCASILPFRKSKSLNDQEIKKLYECVKSVFEKGIKYGGTTKNNYRTVGGTSGGMQHHLKVYGREGQECLRSSFTSQESSLRSNTFEAIPSRGNCQGIIRRKKIAGRSAHFCPICQK